MSRPRFVRGGRFLSARKLSYLHSQAMALLVVLEESRLVVDLSLLEHMLLLSLLEAFECGCELGQLGEIVELLPAHWQAKLQADTGAISTAKGRTGRAGGTTATAVTGGVS